MAFLTPQEMFSAIRPYAMQGVATNDKAVELAICAAIEEAKSYLMAKYDTDLIFSAEGEKRNILVLEHCKSIAVWYLLRASNADILFDKAKEYYNSAIDWFKAVAGVNQNGRQIAASLPLIKTQNGDVSIKMKMGSRKKFSHEF